MSKKWRNNKWNKNIHKQKTNNISAPFQGTDIRVNDNKINTGDKKIFIGIERLSFVVTTDINNHLIKSMINEFAKRFITYSFMYNRRQRRAINIEDKRYYYFKIINNKIIYRFLRESMIDFLNYISIRGFKIDDADTIKITNKVPVKYIDVELKPREMYKLRDYQQKYVDTIVDNYMQKALIMAATGSGKTLSGLATSAKIGKRILILLPGYVDKWEKDVSTVLDIEEDEICTIKGKDSILTLLKEIKEVGSENLKYKVFIASGRTLMIFTELNKKEALKIYDKYYIEFYMLMEILGIGTVLIDEVHEKFYSVFYLSLLLNPITVIGMTATYTSSNEYVKKMQGAYFPKHTILDFAPNKKYIITTAVSYSLLKNRKEARYELQGMYNHDTFEKETLMSDKNRLEDYINMIDYYIENKFINRYKKNDKIIIFVAGVRFATMLQNYFSNRYGRKKIGTISNGLKVTRYVGSENDSYEDNCIGSDFIISTLQSAGTALDIPNLKVVINTVSVVSEVRNKQSHGRLREPADGSLVEYIYLYSEDIEKHKRFHRTRMEQLKPLSKEFKFEKYKFSI